MEKNMKPGPKYNSGIAITQSISEAGSLSPRFLGLVNKSELGRAVAHAFNPGTLEAEAGGSL